MKEELPERWLRASKAGTGLLPEKTPERVWLTPTPTGAPVPAYQPKEPLVTSCRKPEPAQAQPRFREWRELLSE